MPYPRYFDFAGEFTVRKV